MKLIVILLVVGVLAWMLLRPTFKVNPKNSSHRKKQNDIEEMYECPSCGVYISQQEAFFADGHYFCSKECLKKGK